MVDHGLLIDGKNDGRIHLVVLYNDGKTMVIHMVETSYENGEHDGWMDQWFMCNDVRKLYN